MSARETSANIRATLASLDTGTLVKAWRAHGIKPEDLVPDERGTVGRPSLDTSLTHDALRSGELDALGDPDEGGVVQGAVIGSGGMGVVREGTQVVLRRAVAVKQVHPDASPERELRLAAFLREAWVSANLEHPNIIPVHALCSDRGDPLLVMKRVDGVSLRALLEDPELLQAYGGDPRDPLLFHLRVLTRVCRAVHFAHSQGVLHLDLKPDNVMVGRHGEVYLLDWGLATGFRADSAPFLPLARDVETVVGTPGYLSPEQAAGLGSVFAPETDIFLLGATLHRVVTGVAPNRGDTLVDTLQQAYECAPRAYAGSVPRELQAILQRAMARSLDERYGSAEELRLALEHFIEHRDVNDLLDESLRRLALLTDDLPRPASDAESQHAMRRVENECRFGLDEALLRWPENPRAREAQHALARVSVRRALRAGDWRAAAAALERLPVPDMDLLDQVEAARDQEQAMARERAMLEDLGSHEDMLRYANVRSNVAAFVAVGWGIWFFVVGAVVRSGAFPLTYTALLTNVGLTWLIYGGVIWTVRRTLHATQIDRRVVWLLAVCFVGAGIVWLFAMLLGLPPMHAVALSSSVYVFFFIATATVIDRRLAFVAPLLAPAAMLPFVDVAHVFEWQGAYVLLGGNALSLIWRRDARLARAGQARHGTAR
ncbi:MAG: protein kinase [Polyangiales bacterium]|nr:protein kinase [Sandaracinaceae bacterium]